MGLALAIPIDKSNQQSLMELGDAESHVVDIIQNIMWFFEKICMVFARKNHKQDLKAHVEISLVFNLKRLIIILSVNANNHRYFAQFLK